MKLNTYYLVAKQTNQNKTNYSYPDEIINPD